MQIGVFLRIDTYIYILYVMVYIYIYYMHARIYIYIYVYICIYIYIRAHTNTHTTHTQNLARTSFVRDNSHVKSGISFRSNKWCGRLHLTCIDVISVLTTYKWCRLIWSCSHKTKVYIYVYMYIYIYIYTHTHEDVKLVGHAHGLRIAYSWFDWLCINKAKLYTCRDTVHDKVLYKYGKMKKYMHLVWCTWSVRSSRCILYACMYGCVYIQTSPYRGQCIHVCVHICRLE